MTITGTSIDEAALRVLIDAYHAAMVSAETGRLATLLANTFCLVHITGYVQPKDEWFDLIRSGEFDYHRIDIDDRTLEITMDRDQGRATGRGIFDANINGFNAPWRLQFDLRFEKIGGGWQIKSSNYVSF